ncbi:hypothetical protein [Plesiomonas shigelloides]|uniref:hypothetical protein n=1 Tax=Plesiomonas shigelloides TaxID=703 RepID=UPI0012616CE3|nr:hypothetical protein [Plesiomonas shigelloides]KAB7696448.1 hypothetical protein GBN15_10090 [Plesiomonas shigelloides]
MYFKINFLIAFLFCSAANATVVFRVMDNGLYSNDGKLINREISSKASTFSYSLRENKEGVITLYRDAFLNSSTEQCSMEFKRNKQGEYRSSYAVCFDEIISIKDGQRMPALKVVNLNNVNISEYRDVMTTQGEYHTDKNEFSDLMLFDVTKNKPKSIELGGDVYCNYYVKDYSFGISMENIRCYSSAYVKNKTYLYNSANPESETKKYLVPGDNVIPLDEKVDRKNNKWIYILYQGKKDTKMWVNSDALGLGKHIK